MADERPIARPEPPGRWVYEIDGDVIGGTFVPDDPEAFARMAAEDRRANEKAVGQPREGPTDG